MNKRLLVAPLPVDPISGFGSDFDYVQYCTTGSTGTHSQVQVPVPGNSVLFTLADLSLLVLFIVLCYQATLFLYEVKS
jgi:hypothetical protein